jgi:predicted RNA-binding Zn-ribbon protein involved in translation (DUF1610 family)
MKGLITKRDRYEYTCPKCGQVLVSKSYKTWRQRITSKSMCLECRNSSGSPKTVAYYNDPKNRDTIHQRCQAAGANLSTYTRSEEGRNKSRIRFKTMWQSPEFQRKRLESIQSQECRSKIASAVTQLWKQESYRANRKAKFFCVGNKTIGFNENCCDYLDVINGLYKDQGIFFRHALNHPDKEFSCLGYFADGYDENNNIWFEWDEEKHEQPSVKQNDILRQRRVCGYLKCKMLRYSEKNKQTYWVSEPDKHIWAESPSNLLCNNLADIF